MYMCNMYFIYYDSCWKNIIELLQIIKKISNKFFTENLSTHFQFLVFDLNT